MARILLSARDPGGAQLIAQLALALKEDERFEVELAAQGAAFDVMQAKGLFPRKMDLPVLIAADDPGRNELFGSVADLLEQVSPDAVVTALSGPGLGLDEALVSLGAGRPVFSLQDYEGWVVPGFGHPAPTYFVADSHAARLTSRVEQVEAVVVGDLKYAHFGGLDIAAMRHGGRAQAPSAGPLVTFYGQPAWAYPGYRETIEVLARAAGQAPEICFLYRPHPKESEQERAGLCAVFAAEGVFLHRCPGDTIESSLALTDTVLSVFSTVGVDHVNLQRHSVAPIGTTAYLLFDPAIRSLLQADSGHDRPSVVAAGLADCATRTDDILALLRRCTAPNAAAESWRRIQEGLELANGVSSRIIEHLAARLMVGRMHES